jgi:hypothetical protein
MEFMLRADAALQASAQEHHIVGNVVVNGAYVQGGMDTGGIAAPGCDRR